MRISPLVRIIRSTSGKPCVYRFRSMSASVSRSSDITALDDLFGGPAGSFDDLGTAAVIEGDAHDRARVCGGVLVAHANSFCTPSDNPAMLPIA